MFLATWKNSLQQANVSISIRPCESAALRRYLVEFFHTWIVCHTRVLSSATVASSAPVSSSAMACWDSAGLPGWLVSGYSCSGTAPTWRESLSQLRISWTAHNIAASIYLWWMCLTKYVSQSLVIVVIEVNRHDELSKICIRLVRFVESIRFMNWHRFWLLEENEAIQFKFELTWFEISIRWID